MPIQADADFIVEGTVVLYQGTMYYVKKVNPKNFVVIDANSRTYNLRRHPSVKRAPDQDAWTGERPNPYTEYRKAVASGLVLGSTVEMKSATNRRKFPGVFVVIGRTGDKFRLAVIGGDANNYLRGFTAEDLTAVTGTFIKEN